MTKKEIHSELIHCTAQAFRIYHMLNDVEIDVLQYQLAERMNRLLNKIRNDIKKESRDD